MASNQKLELTWLGKGEQPRLEPRLLLLEPEHCYGDPNAENILIHGDNLLALKALEQQYAGKVKCIYIDPPFNTGQAFEHYDDNLEHSIWLNLIALRLKILYNLLDKDGLFWIHLDEEEVHYCKIILDELFGRNKFVSHITYLRSGVAGLGQGGFFVNTTEHLLFYRKGELPKLKILSFQQLELKTMKRYNRIVTDFGKRELVREFIAKSNGCPVRVYKHSELRMNSIPLKDFEKRESAVRKYYSENIGVIFRGNQVQKENSFQIDIISNLEKDGFYSVDYIPSRGKNEDKETTLYYFQKELLSWLSDTSEAFEDDVVKSNKMTTLWDDIPKADIANEGQIYFPRSKKPEQLIKRIIEISTLPGDIVLDSFLGSGTTAAVAHKMGRRWIGIELGEHCYTHCVPRLRIVVSGTDQGGVSKAMDWKGGSGFKTYRLAPSLLAADEHAMLRFNPDFTDDMVAEAVAKIEGFTYAPDPEVFWKQSRSSEQDYLLVTKIFVTAEWLAQLHEQMAEEESLLLCCPAYGDGCERAFSNITLKKIPTAFMRKYEFGKDDYSLNVQNVIGGGEEIDLTDEDLEEEKDIETRPKAKKGKVDDQPTLF